MTDELFRRDSYLRECDAGVVTVEGRSVALDRTVFYPLGGGQPGDSGSMTWASGNATIVDTRYGDSGEILHVLADGSPAPPLGETVHVELDWDRRYRYMRMHTAMHLLGAKVRRHGRQHFRGQEPPRLRHGRLRRQGGRRRCTSGAGC